MSRLTRRVVALACVGGLLVAAASCTSDESDSATGETTTTTVAQATGSPNATSDVAIDPANIDKAIAELPDLVRQNLERTGVPGAAVAVVRDGEVVYSEGFGVREVGKPDEIDPGTRFQIASVSKSVGATVIAAEVGKGTVAWDDPVTKYLTDFELSDPWVTENATIADYSSMRTGLPKFAGDQLEDMGYGRDTVLEKMRLLELNPFRTSYGYANFSITAGAEAVATAAGVPWEQLTAETLYGPLGMTKTTSVYDDFLAATDRAVVHERIDGQWVPSARNPSAQDPAGGVTSTVLDLAKWMQLQLDDGELNGEPFIDEDALLAIRAPAIATGEPDSPISRSSFYGHGMNVGYDPTGRLRLSHSGAFNLGAATNYTLLPAENLGIVVLTNGMPLGVPETVNATFMDIVQTGTVTRDWAAAYSAAFEQMLVNPSELADKTPPANATQRPNDTYVGVYSNPYFGQASVIEVDGELKLRLGPTPMEFDLDHFDGEVFSFTPPGENSLGVSALTFTVEGGGTATTFTSEYYSQDGFGTWTRIPGVAPDTSPVPPNDNSL